MKIEKHSKQKQKCSWGNFLLNKNACSWTAGGARSPFFSSLQLNFSVFHRSVAGKGFQLPLCIRFFLILWCPRNIIGWSHDLNMHFPNSTLWSELFKHTLTLLEVYFTHLFSSQGRTWEWTLNSQAPPHPRSESQPQSHEFLIVFLRGHSLAYLCLFYLHFLFIIQSPKYWYRVFSICSGTKSLNDVHAGSITDLKSIQGRKDL